MRKVISVFALLGMLASCGINKTTSTSEQNQSIISTMNNKQIVGTFLGAVTRGIALLEVELMEQMGLIGPVM